MQIGDAGFVERGGELALGKARPARGRDRAGIDQQLDLGALEFAQHRGGLGLLVADGKQSLHGAVIVMTQARRYIERQVGDPEVLSTESP